jgi:hypothetical protein
LLITKKWFLVTQKCGEKTMSAYMVIIIALRFFLIPAAILLPEIQTITLQLSHLFLYILITPILSQNIMKSMYLKPGFWSGKRRYFPNRKSY